MGALSLVLVSLICGLPILGIFLNGSLDFERLFSFPVMALLNRSFFIAGLTGFFSVFLCVFFALITKNYSERTKTIILSLVILPYFSNGVLRLLGWSQFFLKLDMAYSYFSVILVMTYSYIPLAGLVLIPSVWNVPSDRLFASRLLGASRFEMVYKILIPSISKHLWIAFFMVFTPALGEFVIPDIIGGGKFLTIGNFISMQVLVTHQWNVALTALLFLIVPGLIIGSVLGRWSKEF